MAPNELNRLGELAPHRSPCAGIGWDIVWKQRQAIFQELLVLSTLLVAIQSRLWLLRLRRGLSRERWVDSWRAHLREQRLHLLKLSPRWVGRERRRCRAGGLEGPGPGLQRRSFSSHTASKLTSWSAWSGSPCRTIGGCPRLLLALGEIRSSATAHWDLCATPMCLAMSLMPECATPVATQTSSKSHSILAWQLHPMVPFHGRGTTAEREGRRERSL